MQFKLFSVPVQGTTAGPIIAKGIEAADKDPDVDVIIVGRGGGSMEDLWCFNDRVVIEAIYNASTPIISAVGHETDYTLADYAADMRGATPSHAAEIAVLPLTTLQQHLQQKLDYLQYVMDQTLQQKRIELSTIFNRRLGFPALQLLHNQNSLLQSYKEKLQTLASQRWQHEKHKLSLITQELSLQNPIHLMVKGYSKIEKEGHTISSIQNMAKGDVFKITLRDGSIKAVVEEVLPDGNITEKL